MNKQIKTKDFDDIQNVKRNALIRHIFKAGVNLATENKKYCEPLLPLHPKFKLSYLDEIKSYAMFLSDGLLTVVLRYNVMVREFSFKVTEVPTYHQKMVENVKKDNSETKKEKLLLSIEELKKRILELC